MAGGGREGVGAAGGGPAADFDEGKAGEGKIRETLTERRRRAWIMGQGKIFGWPVMITAGSGHIL